MSDSQVIRRFFRRENDELTMHDRNFPPHLKVIPFHVFESITNHPSIDVVDLTNFENEYSPEDLAPIRWQNCEIGYNEKKRYMSSAYLLATHAEMDSLKFVVAVFEEMRGGVTFRVILKSEDIEKLDILLEFFGRLEKDGHPLKGKLVNINEKKLTFLPDQNVTRSDIILDPATLDEIERNFAFLDRPEEYPAGLRHRALLLAGRPGVGKTMIAKWISGRFKCSCLWITPGTLWDLGPATVIGLARSLKPSLLILEDLDLATGDRRGRQPLGDLLGQMDGFVDLEDVAMIATTNCPEVIDAALDPEQRPGRFHRLFKISPPNDEQRRLLLESLVEKSTVLKDVASDELDLLVGESENKTGAQLTEMVRDIESRILWNRSQGTPDGLDAVLSEIIDDTSRRRKSFGFAGCEVC